MSPSAGALIWISCRPLIRLAAGIASGFIITKAEIFPPVAARGAGQIALNITLPCLFFSRLIPAFTTTNVKAFGPLVLVAVLYELLGVLLAWIITLFFWVPHRFRYGMLIAGGFSNVGDVSTAVILSITGSAPFRGTDDQNLAVAYISVFILVFSITLFPMGSHRLLAWDFLGPDVEPEVVQARTKARRQRILRFFMIKNQSLASPPVHPNPPQIDAEKAILPPETSPLSQESVPDDCTTTVVTAHDTPKPSQPTNDTSTGQVTTPPTPRSFSYYRHQIFDRAHIFIKSLFNPVSVSIYLSIPIALVPQLKALFVEVPGVNMPSAPDGQPPLAFIQDTANFIGAASIPIGLICLGSSLARLNVPLKQWHTLPVGAIIWLAIGKLVIIPVLGILICQGLFQSGILFKDDKVLYFVCMLFSCLPTATTQVYLTQIYSGTGTAEHIPAFLIPQYIIMFIAMTALNAYAIQVIF